MNSAPLWYNLRSGQSRPLRGDPHLTREIRRVAQLGDYPSLAQEKLRLHLDLAQLRHGYGYARLDAGPALAPQGLRPGTTLLSVGTALKLTSAPFCWRYILNDYLPLCAQAQPGEIFASVLPMPRPPWATACPTPDLAFVPRELGPIIWKFGYSAAAELLALAATATEDSPEEHFEFGREDLPELDGLTD